ncbi:proteasome accessory factor PafA2 [Bifidobacterium pullorum subsp. saeculare]|uniref:Proteasome accessory factor PafA2 n=1 Tax=Bifidobacterium pullorum subsp. saeculare TaxID=78257 RepID=A0A938WXJ0_9BIFI|nr:depupylase/deamidase Dop [Bifidobacterium pullorum]MBM6698843.1 proteasome accessory factor PafA2 [Bifidobacterium pullorum subsp. saeculare]
MSVKRPMGTETEYAVSSPGDPHAQPVRLSFEVVKAAADPARAHIRWDYRQEDPVNDMRGTRLDRAAARPDMLTDAPQLDIANVIAPNGGRIYVDHAHPEYSAPETLDPFDAVAYDHAGDLLMRQAAGRAATAAGRPVALHRNNVDGKGASWGTHENYTMARAVPFGHVAALMTAHFVTRQTWAGSGRVGLGERSESAGYQLSQRADYIHSRIGLQTTFDRPIVNTRDEPHAPADRRRLHVIVGDANRMDVPQALKLGTTSMLLWLLEHADEAGVDLAGLLARLALADPVDAMHTVSHDLTLAAPLAVEDGASVTAWQTQVLLRAAVYQAGAAIHGTDTRGEPLWPDRPTRNIMAMWGQALADVAAVRHASDDERLTMAGPASRLEWLLKWQLLERLRRKTGCGWDDARLRALDLRWAALDPAASVFDRVAGHAERLTDAAALAHAAAEPPEDTRAWLRAKAVRRWPEAIVAASWTHLTVRVHPADAEAPAGSGLADVYGNASRAASRPGDLFTLAMAEPDSYGKDACEAAAPGIGAALDADPAAPGARTPADWLAAIASGTRRTTVES